jgi:hypothetical protein
MHSAVEAGLVAAAVSGAPSTVITLAKGEDVLLSARGAGAIVLPDDAPAPALLAAAVPVHLGLSIGWAAVLDRALPPGRELLGGLLGGLAIAALDLGVIGRRIDAVRRLPQPRQWADHVAYGLAVGAVLRAHRRA